MALLRSESPERRGSKWLLSYKYLNDHINFNGWATVNRIKNAIKKRNEFKGKRMKDTTHSTNKRCRSPTRNFLGWAEYDADILDNVFQHKKFAVNVSMASDLASKMTVGGIAESPDRSIEHHRSFSGAEGMNCTPVEGSPCRTPMMPRMPCQGLTSPEGIASRDGESMDGMMKYSGCKSEKRSGTRSRPFSSPSDYQSDLNNLRKLALTRFAAQRSGQDTPLRGTINSGRLSMSPSSHRQGARSTNSSKVVTAFGEENMELETL